MTLQENVKLAKSVFDAINARDKQKWNALQADNAQQIYGPGTTGPLNSEQNWAAIQVFITATPDLHFTVTQSVAEGDMVVLNWTAVGTQTGPLATPSGNSVPPTGKKATVLGSTTIEVKNGKLARSWNYWDLAGFLGQLGLLPPM